VIQAQSSNAARTPFQRMVADESRGNPYCAYEVLRQTPVTREPDGLYVVSTYAEVAQLLVDPRLSADPRKAPAAYGMIPFSFIHMDPPAHDRLRRMTMRHFGPPNDPLRLDGLQPMLRTLVGRLIDRLSGRAEVEVISELAYPLPMAVTAHLLGVPFADEPKFHAWTQQIVEGDPTTQQNAVQALSAYMSEVIAVRRHAPQDDILSRIIHDPGPDEIATHEELVDIAVLLLLGGHETTVNLLANGVLTLLRNPSAFTRLRDQPDLAPFLVEEMLRYESPIQVITRTALSDIAVGGTVIRAGSAVKLLIGAANRDGARFRQADEFIPDRKDNQHLAFGAGVHICFGAPLSRLEGQIAFRELSQRLIQPELMEDPPPYRKNYSNRALERLRIRIASVRDVS
jgi:cytochrome P450